ncbi:hypothetical protein C1H76_0232 [Elsinoe australis]|uniref:DUF1330 domain-containing protein n=1 Tax=Elsinoe australis TaxID=40998 RepID=A0A4U7BBD8_9PEZI|nr:hypothetical protein C1H76_0232 [Elsinoe australis]
MPLLDLHLLALDPSTSARAFVEKLHRDAPEVKVLVASTPHHWVAKPKVHDVEDLGSPKWDLMLLTESSQNGQHWLTAMDSNVKKSYHLKVGVPRQVRAAYPELNAKLLRDAKSVPLTGSLDAKLNPQPSTSQKLEFDDELRSFMESFTKERGEHQPVTMLNLLCFKQDSQEQYATYGKHFQQAGGRRGGNAKIVGTVVRDGKAPKHEEWWNEVAIVHYPSIQHFCDMAAGKDYQEINQKYRLPSLKDTILLCTTELPQGGTSKL